MFRFFLIAVFGAGLAAGAAAEEAGRAVSFKGEIAPLLNRRCAACHNEETPKGRYRLDSFALLRKAGESEEKPLTPGRAEESELYRRLVEADPHDRMPQKADALPPEELGLIRGWIDQGAVYDGGDEERPLVEMARDTFLLPAPEHYPKPAPISALAYAPDGAMLAATGYYEVNLWRIGDGALVRRIGGLPERITALAWNPRRNLIAVAGGTPSQWGTVALIDPAAGYQVRILCDLPETALSVAFNPDGSLLAAGGGDRTIRFFDTKSGAQTRVVRQHADWVQSVEFSPDGKRLLSASRDRTARIFDVATGEIEATYAGHEAPVLAAVFNPFGGSVLSVSPHSRALHRWEPGVSEKKPELIDLGHEVERFAFCDLGCVSIGPDRAVLVTQMSDRRPLFAMYGHRDSVQSLAVAPKRDGVATGGYDGEICVWDFACGTWVQRFVAAP